MLLDTHGSRLFDLDDMMQTEEMSLQADFASNSPDPLESVQMQALREGLAVGINGLPEREKLVLNLYYDEELNLKEIGQILNVSESRVCQILSQSLLRLQSRVRDWVER